MQKKICNSFFFLFSLIVLLQTGCVTPQPRVAGMFPHEMRNLDPQAIRFDDENAAQWEFNAGPLEVWNACLDVCSGYNGGIGQVMKSDKPDDSCVLITNRHVSVQKSRKMKIADKRSVGNNYQIWVSLAIRITPSSPASRGTDVTVVELFEPGVLLDFKKYKDNSESKGSKKLEEMRIEAISTVFAQLYYDLKQALNGPVEWRRKFTIVN